MAKASPPLGGQNALFVGGLGDSVNITLQLPARPQVGFYVLAEGWGGYASYMELTSQGWFLYGTSRIYTGEAAITYVDSTRIEGVFQFTVGGGTPPHVFRINDGAFNVPIVPRVSVEQAVPTGVNRTGIREGSIPSRSVEVVFSRDRPEMGARRIMDIVPWVRDA